MSAERSYQLLQIDAFTDTPLQGNPCAVLLGADDLDAATMQAVALEMNLSETAFVSGSAESGFAARYFTPAEEIPLAGHPTLATARALLDTGLLQHDGGTTAFDLTLRDGAVRVELRGREPEFFMTQREPTFGRVYSAQEVLPLFGLTPDDALPGHAPAMASTGTPMLIVPLRDRDALMRSRLEIEAFASFRDRGDFFSPHLFVLDGFTPEGDTAARHFGVPPDTYEDPYTGSATGAMAAYCFREGLIGAGSFVAEQGHSMGRPGCGVVEVEGDDRVPRVVRVGGPAVTLFEGRIRF